MKPEFTFQKIATVHSCYKQKFGVPRQPGLVDQARAIVEFEKEFHDDYFRELETFSHIWLIFIFHEHLAKTTQALVRPPRLGGNKKAGVFASRSSFRPNPLGMSVVKLEKITKENNRVCLHVSGIDLVDKTPVIDIKPYVSYSDSIPDSIDGYAAEKPGEKIAVKFSSELTNLNNVNEETIALIKQTLALDPRPAYSEDETKVYSMLINNLDIKWQVKNQTATVTEIVELGN